MLCAGALSAQTRQSTGQLLSGMPPVGKPLANATVTLYSAGTAKGAQASQIGQPVTTDLNGKFTLSSTCLAKGGVLYLIAKASSQVVLASVFGECLPERIVVNERTTVATAFAMAQFLARGNIAGPNPGLANAAGTLRNMVDVTTGGVANVLGTYPNGTSTVTMYEFNSLANILAACAQDKPAGSCETLFKDAPAADTLEAVLTIAHFPGDNAQDLYDLSKQNSTYQPVIADYNPRQQKLSPFIPTAWTIAIKYVGNGHEFDGPGNMAIDADGNIWVTQNYTYAKPTHGEHAPGRILTKLLPNGQDAPNAPFKGGGLKGAGFGITIAPNGHVFVGNFAGKTLSEFQADGTAVSPVTGYTNTNIGKVQGMQSDPCGNIWMANVDHGGVVEYTQTGTFAAATALPAQCCTTFGITVDNVANGVWVAVTNDVTGVGAYPGAGRKISMDGATLLESIGNMDRPFDVAVDSGGNVWFTSLTGGKVYLVQGTSPFQKFYGGGSIKMPWGLAIDGDDKVYIADFGGEGVTVLCGTKTEKCPPGHNQIGDSISPSGQAYGHGSGALMRLTAVVIDQSGNVWVADNWKTIPITLPNPGGDGLVQFVGLAAPVDAPMIGRPRQPGTPIPACQAGQ